MVTTNKEVWADKIKMYGLHGLSKDAWKRYSDEGFVHYHVIFPGFKYNMMDIQAAIGIHQMRKLDNFVRVRSKYAKIYDAQLGEMEELVIPFAKPNGLHGRHLYPMRLNLEMLNSDRGTFVKKMKENNIGTTVNFIPIHHHPYYQKEWGFKAGDYPRTEEVYKGLVSIPLYPKMSLDDVEDVISAIKSVIAEMRR